MQILGRTLILVLSLVASSNIANAQTISFQSADYASWYALRTNKSQRNMTLTASWTFPSGQTAEKLPAVVLMHGASGIGGGERLVARHFAMAGYAVLMVDRFNRGSDAGNQAWTATADALNALKVAAENPRIDPARIAIAGISSGGLPVIGASFAFARHAIIGKDLRYAAHIGFYPNCNWASFQPGDADPAPMLLLMAGNDTNAPARLCQDMVELHRATNTPSRITIKVYDGAPHAFLNDEIMAVRVDGSKLDVTRCPLAVVGQGMVGIFREGKPLALTAEEARAEFARCRKFGSAMGYDARVARTALAEATAFLAGHLRAAR